MRHPRRSRAFSLLELSVAAGVFSALLLVVLALFNQSIYVWRATSSSDGANRELRKARVALERDLELTNLTQVARVNVPGHLSGGVADGQALWFLSPLDPATGRLVTDEDGKPVWQRNILYYLVVPTNHSTLFGMTCAGGGNSKGMDDRCPHKLLIRRVIDFGTPTDPADPATAESLIPAGSIAPYLQQPPGGFDISGWPDARIVASNLLTFESTDGTGAINVDVRAVGIDEARREAHLGVDALYDSRFTEQHPFSVFPRN